MLSDWSAAAEELARLSGLRTFQFYRLVQPAGRRERPASLQVHTKLLALKITFRRIYIFIAKQRKAVSLGTVIGRNYSLDYITLRIHF